QRLGHRLVGAGDRLALQRVVVVGPNLGGTAGQHSDGADDPQRSQLLVHVVLSRRSNCMKPSSRPHMLSKKSRPALFQRAAKVFFNTLANQPPSSCWRAARRRAASIRAFSCRARASADERSPGPAMGTRAESPCAWRETIADAPCPALCPACVPSCGGALESGEGPGSTAGSRANPMYPPPRCADAIPPAPGRPWRAVPR